MEEYSKFWPAVRDEYLSGSTQEEAFRNICKQNEVDPPSNKTIGEMLDLAYDKDFYNHGGHAQQPFYGNLRIAVIGQYLKFKHAISSRRFSDYEVDEMILNNRFKLDVDLRLDSITIIDLFNTKVKDIQIEPFDRPDNDLFTMAQIDHDLVLMSAPYNDERCQFLLQIDVNAQTCSTLDTVNSGSIGTLILTDSMNCSNFAYLEYSDEVGDGLMNCESMRKGRIVSNQIIMDDRQINFNCNLYFCKLEDGNIFGFRDIDDFNWQFCEFSPDVGKILKSYIVKLPDYFDPCVVWEYVWSKRNLYVPYICGPLFVIVVFNSDTHQWTQTKVAGIGRYPKLSIDENEILTVNACEGHYEEPFKTVSRFPMKKPENLKYIAWFTIRRASIFFKSNLYKSLLPRLPLNSEFRPFAENYVYDIECDMEH